LDGEGFVRQQGDGEGDGRHADVGDKCKGKYGESYVSGNDTTAAA
jgi:hypothetical protein